MRFNVQENPRRQRSSDRVVQAAELAEAILSGDALYDLISNHPGFDMTEATPEEISQAIRGCNRVATVSIGRFRRRIIFASTRGDHITMNSRAIYGRKRARRGVASVVGTLVHEYVHVVDNFHDEDFGHGGNGSNGKSETAPYWIGGQAVKLAHEMLNDGDETLTSELLAYASGLSREDELDGADWDVRAA